MSEPPCTAEKLESVLTKIIKDTKNALRDLTMKSTLKKAEEEMKLEHGTFNGWHRTWADEILVNVLAKMLEEDPAIADSLDEEAVSAKKPARKPSAKKSEKEAKETKKESKKEPKKEAKKETKKEEEKKEEKKGKESEKDDKKEKKVSAYNMYRKNKGKDDKAWKDMSEEEKAKYKKLADEANAKEKEPVKAADEKKSPKAKAEKAEPKKRKAAEKDKEKDEEPAAKKAKPEPKAKKPKAKKAVQFYIAANKQASMDELGLKTYNMVKCQNLLRGKYNDLSDEDKAEWIKMEEEDAKRIEKESASQK